eukprot:Seg1896.3 transcript_id=Seg1896.3/GoldUCD/mRNA.D3Y31 product="Golgi SNAP receptor complex member 2" protein_id=Seg1896.3/GoldUCD/D3Y31
MTTHDCKYFVFLSRILVPVLSKREICIKDSSGIPFDLPRKPHFCNTERMELLTQQTNRLTMQVQAQLNQLGHETGERLTGLEKDIESTIQEIFANSEKLDSKLIKEPAHRRQNSKLKIDQIKYDARHFDAAFKTYLRKKKMKEDQEKAREDLLSKTFTTNAQSGETTIMIDHSLQHHSRLNSANKGMDEMLDSGQNILAGLKEQRLSLKGIQKRIFDIGNALGLSNTVMRLIEKRGTQDKWILYGGMIVTCVIMYLVYSYLR